MKQVEFVEKNKDGSKTVYPASVVKKPQLYVDINHFCPAKQETVKHGMGIEIDSDITTLSARIDSGGVEGQATACQHCGIRIPEFEVSRHDLQGL